MNHKITMLFLFLGTMALFFACQKDEQTFHAHTSEPIIQPPFTISMVNKNKISENKALLSQLINLQEKQKEKNRSVQEKTAYSSEYDFYIETDYATYIENQDGSYHSYTFPMWRLEDNGLLENMFFSLQPNGTYKTFIVSYDITEQERIDLSNGMEVHLEERTTYTEIDGENLTSDILGKTTTCGVILDYQCYITACDYNLGDGVICGCWDPEWTGTECGTVVSWGDCGTGGGTPPDGTTNPNTTHGGTGTGGSGTTGTTDPGTSDPGNTTSPTLDLDSPEYLRKKNFIRNQLNLDQRDWFNNQTEVVQNVIIEYLENQYLNDDIISNEYPGDAAEFAAIAIDALADEGSVDFEREIIIENNVPDCVKSIINDLLNENAYLDLGDMPDEVKQELNLSGYILDLFNNANNFQLTFKSENILPNANGDILNAKTARGPIPGSPGNFFINITVDSSYISNATDLAITRTIIHESLHAFIVYTYQTDIFSDLSQAFTILLTAAGMPEDDNPPQHQLMVDRFVNAMANSLRAWDNNSITDSNYYDYISWSGGMITTSTFANKPASFQQNVFNANSAEGQAGNNGAYNALSAKGEKNCN